MNEKIPCKVIKDIMPLYLDELTSEETKQHIKEHLKGCSECALRYEQMQTKLKQEEQNRQTEQNVEIDYMKKVRSFEKKNFILGCIVSFFLGMSLPAVRFFSYIMLNGGTADYQLARIQVAWHLGIFKILISGMSVCMIYFSNIFSPKEKKKMN